MGCRLWGRTESDTSAAAGGAVLFTHNNTYSYSFLNTNFKVENAIRKNKIIVITNYIF